MPSVWEFDFNFRVFLFNYFNFLYKKHLERSTFKVCEKVKIYIFGRIESKNMNKYLYIHVCNSIIHNSQKVEAPKYPLMSECRNKMCYVHTIEYYSASKKEGNSEKCCSIGEILSHYDKQNDSHKTTNTILFQLHKLSKADNS